MVTSGPPVNFNVKLLVIADFLDLLAGKSVLESLLEKDGDGNALPQLVRASVWARCA